MLENIIINGTYTKDFEAVRNVFEENFKTKSEIGAAVTVFFRGEMVIDLWAGYADYKNKILWNADTKSVVFSTTKGMCALCLAILHSKGYLDYDEKISTYWPEFAVNGKKDITVRQFLAHQAGLCALDKRLSYDILINPAELSNILATQKLRWKTGDYQGYHAWTMAMYLNEILKRVDPKHREIADFFEDEIAKPLGLNSSIGLKKGDTEENIAQLIPFYPTEFISKNNSEDWFKIVSGFANPFSLWFKTLLNPPFSMNLKNFNKTKYRQLPLGSAMGIFSARDLAIIYNETLKNPSKLGLTPSTLSLLEEKEQEPKIKKRDIVLDIEIPFSLGFAKSGEFQKFGLDNRAFGSFGAGGSGAIVDPASQISYAYVMNKMGTHLANDPRERALREAIFSCVKKIKIESSTIY
jgi:CubicO group peptidase (beta-lactamase class C family)